MQITWGRKGESKVEWALVAVEPFSELISPRNTSPHTLSRSIPASASWTIQTWPSANSWVMGTHLLPHQTGGLFLLNMVNIHEIRQGNPARNFLFKNFINSAADLMLDTKKQEWNSYYCFKKWNHRAQRNFLFIVDHFRSWPQTPESLEDNFEIPSKSSGVLAVSLPWLSPRFPQDSPRCGEPFPLLCV